MTINLSQGSPLGGIGMVQAVQALWVLQVMFTFPLQLFPAAKIIERGLGFAARNSDRKWAKNGVRAALLLACMAVSLGGYRSVDNLVSVVGSLGCVSLAITLPAIFHRKVAREARVQLQQPDLEEEYQEVAALDASAGGGGSAALLAPPASPHSPRWRFLGGATSDLAIATLGAVATLLAVVVAIQAWADSSFEFQPCVVRNASARH